MNTGKNFERWSDAFSSLGPRVTLRLQFSQRLIRRKENGGQGGKFDGRC